MSADFLSKLKKLFGGENWHESSYFDTLPSLLSFLKLPLGGAKDEHFSFFQRSCQLGFNLGKVKRQKKDTYHFEFLLPYLAQALKAQ